jgi:hypothetical protein
MEGLSYSLGGRPPSRISPPSEPIEPEPEEPSMQSDVDFLRDLAADVATFRDEPPEPPTQSRHRRSGWWDSRRLRGR